MYGLPGSKRRHLIANKRSRVFLKRGIFYLLSYIFLYFFIDVDHRTGTAVKEYAF